MHLGYHIYDLGFHSQNSEAAAPMVFTTTLLLVDDRRHAQRHGHLAAGPAPAAIRRQPFLSRSHCRSRQESPDGAKSADPSDFLVRGRTVTALPTSAVRADRPRHRASRPRGSPPAESAPRSAPPAAADGPRPAGGHRPRRVDRRPKPIRRWPRKRPSLEVVEFNLWYGQKQALFDINMRIPKGKVTALIGPSGCGKSTLLRSVNRLNDLNSAVRIAGDIRLNGDSTYAPSVDVIELRKRMGMVFQKSNPFPMSIYENVVYSLRIDGERDRRVLDDVCEQSLRGAALWDEVKDRLHESALSAVRRPAAAAVHRPGDRRRAGSAADGRALLGARSDRHRQDRGLDPGAARRVSAC